MDIKIRKYESINIIDINGEIDLYNYSKLKETINNLKSKGIKLFIINFEKVTYIDSSGVGALININSILKEPGCSLFICGLHGTAKRVIELTKLTGFFPITETIQEAIIRINDKKEVKLK